ncbi:hypothetical protein O1L44_06820 [Streptomyces noursei]|nr:hypothetical protein [Streptomyces noursei]
MRCSLEPVLAGRRWLDVECERAGFTRAPPSAPSTPRRRPDGLGGRRRPAHRGPRTHRPGLRADTHRPAVAPRHTVFSRAELTGAAAEFTELLRGWGAAEAS